MKSAASADLMTFTEITPVSPRAPIDAWSRTHVDYTILGPCFVRCARSRILSNTLNTVNQFADQKYGCEFLHGASCRGLVKSNGRVFALLPRDEKDVTERDASDMANLATALRRVDEGAHAATDVIRGGDSGSFAYSAGRPHE